MSSVNGGEEMLRIFKKQARAFHLVFNESILNKLEEFKVFIQTKPLRYSLCRRGLNKKGKPHAHVYLSFERPVQLSSRNCYGAHIAKCRGNSIQNIAYIESHHPDLIWEIGNRPASENEKDNWEKFVDSIKANQIDKYDKMYARFENYANRRLAELKDYPDYEGNLKEKNIWIYGPTRCGKSYLARHFMNCKVYDKPANKWWDGYDGEKVVVIEDLDPKSGEHLARFIKQWADRYPFTAALKGSSMVIAPSQFHLVVTSNYSIDQIFDVTDAPPIKERFEEWHITEPLNLFEKL